MSRIKEHQGLINSIATILIATVIGVVGKFSIEKLDQIYTSVIEQRKWQEAHSYFTTNQIKEMREFEDRLALDESKWYSTRSMVTSLSNKVNQIEKKVGL